MSGRWSATIALYLLFLAGWSALDAVRDRQGGAAWGMGLVIVWVALLAQATGAAVGLAEGNGRLDEPAVFWGYLALSVLLPPLATARLGGTPARAASACFAIVLTALAVVVWRLNVLWSTA